MAPEAKVFSDQELPSTFLGDIRPQLGSYLGNIGKVVSHTIVGTGCTPVCGFMRLKTRGEGL